MGDKRRSVRVELDVYLNKYIQGVPYMVRSKDISPEGIYLTQLIEPESDDQRIGVQFQLPGTREVIYAEGEIVREQDGAKGRGNGIRFTLITDHHRELVERFVRERLAA
jgi:hypothetical protein